MKVLPALIVSLYSMLEKSLFLYFLTVLPMLCTNKAIIYLFLIVGSYTFSVVITKSYCFERYFFYGLKKINHLF